MVIDTLPEELQEAAVDLWRETGLTRPWNDPLADLRRAVDSPAATVVAAMDDGRVLGTAMVGHDGHRGWVYYLAVSPRLQRAGIGRQLMDACERWLSGKVPKLQLMIRRENESAGRFYEQLGYVPRRCEGNRSGSHRRGAGRIRPGRSSEGAAQRSSANSPDIPASTDPLLVMGGEVSAS